MLFRSIIDRKKPDVLPEEYLPYCPDENLVPPMACTGEGYSIHVTGLAHDERGYPVIDERVQNNLVTRLIDKIRKNSEDILRYEEYMVDDADIIVVSYGSASRSAREAIDIARGKGIKAGLLRPITIWPFPEDRIHQLANRGLDALVVAEINFGQIVYEVQRCSDGRCPTYLVPRMGGSIHTPDEIVERLEKVDKDKIQLEEGDV